MKFPDGFPENHYKFYWDDANLMARKLTIQSGVIVNVFCDNIDFTKIRRIYFIVGSDKTEFECLDDVEKVIKNKSFL